MASCAPEPCAVLRGSQCHSSTTSECAASDSDTPLPETHVDLNVLSDLYAAFGHSPWSCGLEHPSPSAGESTTPEKYLSDDTVGKLAGVVTHALSEIGYSAILNYSPIHEKAAPEKQECMRIALFELLHRVLCAVCLRTGLYIPLCAYDSPGQMSPSGTLERAAGFLRYFAVDRDEYMLGISCIRLLYATSSLIADDVSASAVICKEYMSGPKGMDLLGFLSASVQHLGQAELRRMKPPEPHNNSTHTASGRVCGVQGFESLFLEFLGAYDNVLNMQCVRKKMRANKGLRVLHKGVLQLSVRFLKNASDVKLAAIAMRCWHLFSSEHMEEEHTGQHAERSTPVDIFTPVNVRNLLSLIVNVVRNHSYDMVELRASVDCVRSALKHFKVRRVLECESISKCLGLISMCISNTRKLRKRRISESVALVMQLLATMVFMSHVICRAVVFKLNLDPNILVEADPNHSLESPRQVDSRSTLRPSQCATSLPFLLQLCASEDPRVCVYSCAFVEACAQSLPNQDFGSHLEESIRHEIISKLVYVVRGEKEPEHLDIQGDSFGVDSSFRRAACLRLLSTLFIQQPFTHFLDTVLFESLKLDRAVASEKKDIRTSLRLYHLSLDLATCIPVRYHRMQRFLQLQEPPPWGILTRALEGMAGAGAVYLSLTAIGKACYLKARASAMNRSTPSSTSTFDDEELGHEPVTRNHSICIRRSFLTDGPLDSDALIDNLENIPASWFTQGIRTLSCMFHRRLGHLLCREVKNEDEWTPSIHMLATCFADAGRSYRDQSARVESELFDTRKQLDEILHRVKVTREVHEAELRRATEDRARAQGIWEKEGLRLQEENAQLRNELNNKVALHRKTMGELQDLLDKKQMDLDKLKISLNSEREQQVSVETDSAKLHRRLQIQIGFCEKQREEIASLERRLLVSLDEQRETTVKLADCERSLSKAVETNAQLQQFNDKMQDESEQQFRQLILILKALSEEKARTELLQSQVQELTGQQQQLKQERLQQLESQLIAANEDKENLRSINLRVSCLEQQVCALTEDNDKLHQRYNNERRAKILAEEQKNLMKERAETAVSKLEHCNEELKKRDAEKRETEERLAAIQALLRTA